MTRHLSILAALVVCTTVSAIDPGSLPTAGPIISGGGDADFLAELPTLNALYSNVTPSSSPGPTFFQFAGAFAPTGWNLRVYFVSKEAGYQDAIAFSPTAGNAAAGTTIFANTTGLTQGDYVQLTGPLFVSIFAITNDAPGGGDTWWDNSSFNPDGVSHLQAAQDVGNTTPSSIWYAVALDDQFGGGDRDWNDVRMAFHFYQVTAPEPATWALLAGFAAIGAWLWRRRSALA